MLRPIRLALCIPAVLLASCGEDAPIAESTDGNEAVGEVLEGSISDAMIATDELQSQAPRIVEEAESSGSPVESSADPADDAASEGDAADAAAPAPEPAAPADE